MTVKDVYVAQAGDKIKIGVSNDPESRIKQLGTANPYDVDLIRIYESLCGKGRTAKEWESHFHKRLSEYQINGEWFAIEALEELDEMVEGYRIDVDLSDRQRHALGVAMLLEDKFPDGLTTHERANGDFDQEFPESRILRTIMDRYDLPHGACSVCAHIAYYHRSEDGKTCQRCGATKQ